MTLAVIMEAFAQKEDQQVVISTLPQRATQLVSGTTLRSLSTASSAFKMWHMFAVGFLNYPTNGPLPPRSEEHVMARMATFRNSGTAHTMFAAVRWACKSFDLSGSWDTDRISMMLNGGKRIAMNMVGTTLTMQTLLVMNVVREVVQLEGTDRQVHCCRGLHEH